MPIVFGVCSFLRPQQVHHMGFDQFGMWLNDDGHVVEPTNTRIHGAVPYSRAVRSSFY